MSITENRLLFLKELRSGKYVKGTIESDELTGKPIFNNDNKDGYCACALMHDLFYEQGVKSSSRNYLTALAVTPIQCRFIQKELNDTSLTFNEIADKIQNEIFNINNDKT